MNGPIRRLTYGIFIGFGLLALATSFIQGVRADALRTDPANPRVVLSLAGKERGAILGADGSLLAVSELVEGADRRFVRRYPEGATFAWPVGHTTALFGESGLEASYSDQLRSRQDLTISDLLTAIFGGDLRPRSLGLTIDPVLQRVADEALGERRGSVIALDPTTGAVLAWVSHPSYDPQAFVADPAYARTVAEDETQPLLDRGARVLAPPASTFKLVVTAAALESGEWLPSSTLPDPAELPLPGSTAVMRNPGGGTCAGGGEVTLAESLVRSCNIPFAELAIELGSDPVVGTAEAFGWTTEIETDLPVSISPFPDPGDDLAALAQTAIGERDARATTLQMASVVATIAAGGERVRPFLVGTVFDADGGVESTTEPVVLGRAISETTAAQLTDMMEDVVARGTGSAAALPGVAVAGKTGTSETGPVWFVGFAPVDDPTIAIAVLVTDPGPDGSGGRTAAPIARAVLAEWILR
ncbi:MAG: penicillin-binding protein 2 [Acidimicrobiia bacterium]